MRVLHLTRDYLPRTNGGISTAVFGWVQATTTVAHAVVSFDAWRPTRSSVMCDVTETQTQARVGAPAVLRVGAQSDLEAAEQFARRQQPDVVHVHHAMLWPFARRLDAPRVFTVHVDQREQARLRELAEPSASQLAQDEAMAEAQRVIVPSRAVLARLSERVPRERLRQVPFGVALPTEVASAERAREPTALYVGRFADVKGTAELFAAIQSVVAKTGARFVIAGGLPDSPKRDRRWRRRLRASLEARALAQVELTGWLDARELSRRMRTAWLLVAPSWTETFGLAVLDAMAHQLPVVGCAVDGIAELVRHGQQGLLSPPRDVPALCAHLVQLLSDPATCERMGRAARQRATDFSWAGAAEQLESVYRELS